MWPSALQVENHILEHALWADPWRVLSLDESVESPVNPKVVTPASLTNALKLSGAIGTNIV